MSFEGEPLKIHQKRESCIRWQEGGVILIKMGRFPRGMEKVDRSAETKLNY